MPRGRTYARNGSVIDLQIEPAKITALVMGSSLYHQTISIIPLQLRQWARIKGECCGRIDSLVELLQGRLSDSVMAVITDRQEGMFPLPVEIKMSCSCPDSAGLCKHLAAVLYGVGARLDNEPELLFKLRQADQSELISHAVSSSAMPSPGAAEIDAASLSEVFGIDISTTDAQSPPEPKPKARPQKAKAKETKPITKKKPRKVVAKAKQPVAKGKSENAKAKRKKTAAKAAIKRPGTKPATQARTR